MRKTYVLLAILVAIIGLMMIFSPENCIKVAVLIIGTAALINGIYNLVTVRNLLDDSMFRNVMTVRGAVSICIGILALVLPLAFAGIFWTIMVYTIAVYLLLSAFSELSGITKMKAADIETRPYKMEILASIVLAVLLFCMPRKIGVTLIKLGGFILVIGAAVAIFLEWKNKPLYLEAEVLPNDIDEK